MLKYEIFLKTLNEKGVPHHKQRSDFIKPDAPPYHAMPLVFTSIGRNIDVQDRELTKPLDLPFKTVFVEMLDTSLNDIVEDSNGALSLEGILIHEVAPMEYTLLGLFKHFFEGEFTRVTKTEYFVRDMAMADPSMPNLSALRDHVMQMVDALMERFYTEQIGTSSPRTVVKLRDGKTKIFKRISRVIYVSAKRTSAETKSIEGREINWEHRWRVRGHWRNMLGRIGKNRDGLPIKDFTWVTDHVKGPEEAPLVEKIRVVRDEN